MKCIGYHNGYYTDQWMRQQCEACLAFPEVHPGLVYRNSGIHVVSPIPAYRLVMSCPSDSIIRMGTVPKYIKQIPKLNDHEQIVLYVLILKNSKQKLNELELNPKLNEWINTKTIGFVTFSPQLIKQCIDEQLKIEYAAFRAHYRQQAIVFYRKNELQEVLNAYTNIKSQQQFMEKWIQASQFKNTRSFGHTNQYLLIPGLDYFNYDPSKECRKIIFVTYDSPQELQKLNDAQGTEEEEEVEDSDIEDQVQEVTKKYIGMYSLKPLQPEQELFFDYGRLSNYKLLKNYGFAVKNNPWDYVAIYLSNYFRETMLFFSSVERSTTRYKLYANKLNNKFIYQWVSIHEKFQKKSSQIYLVELIDHMKKIKPPKMPFKKLQQLKNEEGFTFVALYQYEQEKIYEQSIFNLMNLLKQKKEKQ